MSMFEELSAEFPRDSVHWRAQTLTQDGSKALALAYIDARHVMNRLDEVCGPANWSDSYVETPKGRVICTIAIKTAEEGWVSKSDGAGDTDVEGDKGGVSDAFKRAAVKWGIGRYLYQLPSVWAPCEFRENNGKKYWKAWKGSPWDAVRASAAPRADPVQPNKDAPELILTLAKTAGVELSTICDSYNVKDIQDLSKPQREAVVKRLNLTIADKAKEAA